MSKLWIVGVALAIAALICFAIPFFTRKPKPDLRRFQRLGAETVIRIPERRPSAGIAWSRRAYPNQFTAANAATSEFVGIDDFQNERFMDIGGRAYSREWNTNFSYTDPSLQRPAVRLEYLRQAETFTGRLIGQGLKPNFAYQVKLRGIYAADKDGFERIGHTGRWRLPGRGTNYVDEVYAKYPHQERVESYLLFDFFITDPAGSVRKDFYADSTLHVLWSVNYQRTPRVTDTRPVRAVREGGNPLFYASARPDLSPQEIFAESEQHSLRAGNRPAVNEAFLPPGKYVAEVVLTEESFHSWGDNGFWATVMRAPVEFEVVDRPRPTPYWSRAAGDGQKLSLARASLDGLTKTVCTDDLFEGEALNEEPYITFAEEMNLTPGPRYLLCLDLRAEGRHTWQLFIDGDDWAEKPAYVIDSEGAGAWQRFELEITSQKRGYIRLVPTTAPGAIGLRNVSIRRVAE